MRFDHAAKIAPLVLLLAGGAATALNGGTASVDTIYGPVLGSVLDGMGIWRSIPFAAPPVGTLRFRAPQAPQPWTTPIDASGFAKVCPQIKLDGSIFDGSEDCLYLSVYAPNFGQNHTSPLRLPVLFWIYGGAFVLGDDEEFGIYDGVNLANRTGHIIVASNYRVGPFGFMALDQLAKEDKDGSTGNAAMQDQAAALMWVRDNIAAFGGDPEKVTIFGESAGGFSVGWHLTSQSSTGLFRGAIMESGSTDTPQFFQNISDAVAFNSLYAAAIGCNASAMPLPPDGSDPSVDPLLVCLRGKSTEHIMESLLDMLNPDWPFVSGRDATAVATATHTELRDRLADVAALRGALNSRGAMPFGSPRLPALSPLMPWGPAIDGKPTGTLAMPLALIRAGQFNKVPVILGTNKDEGTIFVPAFLLIDRNISWPPSDSDLPAIVRRAFNMYDEAAVASATDDIIMPAYPAAAYTDNFHRAAAMIKHAVFSCVARRTAQALVAAGVPTWMYRFSFNATSHWLWQVLGDAHGSELTYVFRNEWFEAFDAQDSQISDAFSAFWGNMASALDPNDGVAVPAQWPAFTAEGEEYLELQLPFTAGQHLDAKVCDAWDAFEAAVQGSTSLARTLKLSS